MELPPRKTPLDFYRKTASPNGKRRWLCEHFEDVSCVRISDGKVSLWLPHAYRFVLHPDDEAQFEHGYVRSPVGKPPLLRFRPERVEITASSENEAITQIFRIVRKEELKIYRAKPGEKEDQIIDPAQYYPIVYEDDPRHSHAPDSHLIDFITAQSYAQGMVKGQIAIGSPTHSHLLMP